MTWKKTLWLAFFILLGTLLVVHFIVFRQRIRMQAVEIMGVRSVFPAGDFSAIRDAKNGWQGYGFVRHFRLFYRTSAKAGDDFRELVRDNFGRSPLKQDLDLFGGGTYVLQKAGKGYRMFCLFFRNGATYWADMVSPDSLHFACQAFERFILGLEIDGEKTSPAVAGQIFFLHERISPFFMQTPGQLLAMMGVIFALVMLIVVAFNRFSGSCPRRHDMAATLCTPWATLVSKGFGRRQVTACCLCLEGESLVIYRFRRLFLEIDLRSERQHIDWKKNSLYYKNFRVILSEDEFQNWRLRTI
ncbi:MAG: hypothetical protein NTW95_13200 [Candidatus Aminicenantes bacterium]|nr:hypothetical protein [Candidatus Aminicenantes bacterium]